MINNIKKIFKLKKYIYGHLNFLIELKAINKKDTYLALVLACAALFFEALGVSILVPLLSFIQVNGDIEEFKSNSLLSLYLYNSLNFLKVNFLIE